MTTPLTRLSELGIVLPDVVAPLGAYVPARRSGQFVYTSGQLPLIDGELPRTGKVGQDITPEHAYDLARTAGLNALAAVHALVGLDEVAGVVKVVGYVASRLDFFDQPKVVNGASDLFGKVFGDQHARSAVGVAALPLDSPVEIELIVELR